MKKTLLVFCLVFDIAFVKAQINLVPNFSFEQYDTCPHFQDQIQYATGWSKYSIYNSTPDYDNACDNTGQVGVPNNAGGYHQDHRHCNAYVGLVTFGEVSNDRERIGIQLSQSLTIGQKYFLSFYTVMGYVFQGGNYYLMPSNNIGLRLSTIPYSPANPAPIDNFAHLYSSSVITDSVNWTRISGSIIADSAYNYIMVGNFFDDIHTDTIHYNCSTCLNYLSYYLVDDICISTDSSLCNGGVDLLPCNVSVPEISLIDDVNVFPNPVTDIITISFQNNQYAEFILYDILGNVVYPGSINNTTVLTIDISSFLSGCYTLKIINKKNNSTINKKIIKL